MRLGNHIITCLWLSATSVAATTAGDYDQRIRPILNEYCISCHSTEKQKGDLDLERFTTMDGVKKEPEVWVHALDQIHDQEMPPKAKPQPSPEQLKMLTQWMQSTLDEVALATAGDPGPVPPRRLSNMEYTYTVRDLTGISTLDPAKEFPVDGAAGEGFTNAGAALVMSPSLLTKYLDAAKEISAHAVLLPDGFAFSPSKSARDWTEERLAQIRALYARYSEAGGATKVNLQGIKFDTNAGGRLPVEKYVDALNTEREALLLKSKSIAQVSQEHGLNAKYLELLFNTLQDTKSSLILDSLRAQWRAGTLNAADIIAWQQALWRFTSIGHIGKKNGPKGWQEPVTPLVSHSEMRLKLAPPPGGGDVTLYLSTGDAGDGAEQDFALWEHPRLVAPGRPDLPLREVQRTILYLSQRRTAIIRSIEKCLAAMAEADAAVALPSVDELAKKYKVEPELLTGWLDYLGLGGPIDFPKNALLVKKTQSTEYNFIRSWSGADSLGVVANSSDNPVRVPGFMKPHSIAVHPSPKLAVTLAWRSPVTGRISIHGSVQHVHPECGNGITWALEIRRGTARERLAHGHAQADSVIPLGNFENVRIAPGDVVCVIIGSRDGNHTCDLTSVDLTLNDGSQEWDAARELSPDLWAGNPHADSHGHKDVWHFSSEPEVVDLPPAWPEGSLIAQWHAATDVATRQTLAREMEHLFEQGPAEGSPDRAVYERLLAYNGPLLSGFLRSPASARPHNTSMIATDYGLQDSVFGSHPTGAAIIDRDSICVQAPSVLKVKLPAALAEGAEFVVDGRLEPTTGAEGSVQMQVSTTPPQNVSGLAVAKAEAAMATGLWSDNNLRTTYRAPFIVNEHSTASQHFTTACDDFRAVFPTALCYTKIVPVDEVVTLRLFYREDECLQRLMLNESERQELDRLWEELRFVSESPLKQVDAFEQLYQFATQDADPSAFEPLREPIKRDAEVFKQRKLDAEPVQVQKVLSFAVQAWRRPVTNSEKADLLALYQKLRGQEIPHAAALRMMLARVMVAPAFLYRFEKPAPGPQAAPINDWELASRLSYFLWASLPDEELRSLAAAGRLHEPQVLAEQTRRMLKDEKVRRLATEFGCQWLHVRDIETLDEKSERHFPTFVSVRGAMQEEAVRFFTDLFQEDRSVLNLIDADYSFVDGTLAKHYGLRVTGDAWQRVAGLHAQGRGGMLGFAGILAKQSGASRTSPILRGNWLSEVVLGEKLPRPPKGVPILPEETPQGLTERQLIERHSTDAKCAVCHQRIDPFGFALEGFDAIGRARSQDATGLAIDTRVKLRDGTQFEGMAGLRAYLLNSRRDDFLRQFSRKLLGYALGRGVQLSDKPLLDSMVQELYAHNDQVGVAMALIVSSPQFRQIRGRDYLSQN